ncbi:MAG: hypothetical protein SPK75_02240 [Victivallales bacterium]|nr:hypothetical protein [Victivallales bacterium]
MTKEDEKKLGSMIEAGRMAVPEANRAKFDAEARDVFENVRAAMDKGDEKRAKGLLERWKGRTLFLTREERCWLAPPFLVRKNGESEKEYMDRCYKAGGF